MINHSTKDLYQKRDEALQQLKRCKNPDESRALQTYIGNLSLAIRFMGDKSVSLGHKALHGTEKAYKEYVRQNEAYDAEVEKNFIENREFHQQFLRDVIPDVECELYDEEFPKFPKDKPISRKEFEEILYSFFQSYGIEKLFDEIYRGKKIYTSSSIAPMEAGDGFAIYNPINQDARVFINRFRNDYVSMTTTAHEIGHIYDFRSSPLSISDYNLYLHSSYYGEVMSRLFEKLLQRYMLKNHIMVNSTKEMMITFANRFHGYMFSAFISTFIEPFNLLMGDYKDWDKDDFMELLKDELSEDSDIEVEVNKIQTDGIQEIFSYAYGDMISLLLAEDVEKNGLHSEMMEKFMRRRIEPFSEDFLREFGVNTENYMKAYQKEMQLIKK